MRRRIDEDHSFDRWRWIIRNWSVVGEHGEQGPVWTLIGESGIHDLVRGQAWICLARSEARENENPGLFSRLLATEAVKQEDALSRDIKRTFPRHQLFADGCAIGQRDLFQVLRAYAAYDEEVGYCQGMGFIVAVLLCYMGEEEAFWLMVSMMEDNKYRMRSMFMPSMPIFAPVMDLLSDLIGVQLSKLHQHFKHLELEPGMYASQWFMTLFAYNFPFSFVTRVWDVFFVRGWEIIFKVGIVLLSSLEQQLLHSGFEQIIVLIRDVRLTVDADKVVREAMEMTLPERAEIRLAVLFR